LAGYADRSLDLLDVAAIPQEQGEDRHIGAILQWKLSSEPRTPWTSVAALSDESRTYWAQWDSLIVVDGVLYRNFVHSGGTKRWLQVFVTMSVRRDFMRTAHDTPAGEHFGRRRTADQVQRRAYWPGWRKTIEECCRNYEVCARVHRGHPPRQAPLKTLDVNRPMDRIQHIDLCGPFPRSEGKVYILTCVDAFTR
jgi:hypothetical protein